MKEEFIKMNKVKEKSNIRLAYDALNNEKKKTLLEKFNEEFNQRSQFRFYKVLNIPKKMSAYEADFFAENLKMARAKVTERNTIVATKKEVAETLKLSK